MRLLIVEDEARIIDVLRAGLVRAGFVIDAVQTCADARDLLSSIAYDTVILDLGLPDSDGLTLLAQVRSAGNQVPVLVLTARDAVEHRVAGLDAGASRPYKGAASTSRPGAWRNTRRW
jgi:DNA-binding response OmpR family regulator